MYFKGLVTACKTPHKRAMYRLMGDAKAFIRIHFHYAAIKSGLVEALREPVSKDDLREKLSVVRPELLDSLLDLGLALGELSFNDELYSPRGRFFRSLMSRDGEGLAGLVEALVDYYNSVYRQFTPRLTGAPLGDYLPEIGHTVARASRVVEPYVKTFLKAVLPTNGAVRVLDVGCGSAGYLLHCSRINPRSVGLGLEMDPNVAALAEENLLKWGINDRFQILAGDFRRPPGELDRAYDFVFFFNAVYYFPPDERIDVFRRLKQYLAPRGKLVVICQFQGHGRDIFAANLDTTTRSIQGCWSLPDLAETKNQLTTAGFTRLRVERVMPGASYYGLIAG